MFVCRSNYIFHPLTQIVVVLSKVLSFLSTKQPGQHGVKSLTPLKT